MLNAQLVSGKMRARRILKRMKSPLSLLSNFSISSAHANGKTRSHRDEMGVATLGARAL